ncbi:Erp family protein (plasmid) [Borreliella bissettiae DN127]|uniref:Erp family protein n=1 Tax=Borrelia bissettiae (strain DSM 17990 / CIP 109136 / DN127) TaxID=521010 RepID=G0AN84_BORBD|nr:Erp family protein [Borreliella bissettiae]AEL19160.1 Erp family protein [Borreliella bissettiae DN127]
MNKKTFIICAVFALIISCKNYSGAEDLKQIKQNAEGKIKGFLDKILDPVKDKIASNGPKVDELVKKLQEEEKELMQGDDPNSRVFNLPPESSASSHKNIPNIPILKAEEQSGAQQEEEKVEKAEAKVEEKKEKQVGIVENAKEKEIVAEQNQEEEAKAKAEKEKREREAKAKKEHQEREREREEEKQVKDKIKDFVDKIDKINRDIDSINPKSFFEERMEVSGQEVEDKVTGAIYDDFTNSNSSGNSLYSEWSDSLEESGELKGLIDKLEKTRGELRKKIKEGEDKNEKNKNVVKVGNIKEDLEKLKSELDEVKNYLEDESNFEEIKGYIDESNS